jgi:hypothetical protein
LNTTIGCEELSITHPGKTAATGSIAEGWADCDVDGYPRAIISKVWTYNFENNRSTGDIFTEKLPTNAYFVGKLDSSLDAAANSDFGGID